MTKLTVDLYEEKHSNCEGLCDIDPDRIAIKDPTKMPCVTCPFCKEIVTAELTAATIHCPACKITVKRN